MKNNKISYRIGLNIFSHDTACCLFKNNKLLVAIEEERLSYKKHTKNFPFKAIQKCIEFEKIHIDNIDVICVGWDIPFIIKERYLRNIVANNNSKFLEDKRDEMIRVLSIDENLKKIGFKGKVEYFNHYDCHTAYAFSTSKFKEALYISLDGYGEDNSGKIGSINTKRITDCINYPIKHSLGLLYAGITDFLGFKRLCDEGIVMGLAAHGDYKSKVKKLKFTYHDFFKKNIKLINGNIIINENFFLLGLEKRGFFTDKFFKLFGKKRKFGEDISKHHQNIAAGFQRRIEEIIYGLAKYLNNKYKLSNLILSGGLALNCVSNGKIYKNKKIKKIHVPSAPGDNGVAIGAVILSIKKEIGLFVKIEDNPYLGPAYKKINKREIQKILSKNKFKISKFKNHKKITNQLINRKIIGIFQGRSEFGPRALGNRSIISKPFPYSMKDHMNKNVKFREGFRPFAPIILERFSKKFFDLKENCRNMTKTFQSKAKYKKLIPAAIHVDGGARVQTVNKKQNQFINSLLEEFYKQTNIPVIINTSFNVKGQPIIETQLDALKTFKSTKIDCLVIDNFFIEKK